MMTDELVFNVTEEADGGYTAEGLGEDIFAEGDSWEALRENVLDAVRAFYFDSAPPQRVRLHLARDEVLSTA
jgi:hypothetical protein